MTLVELMVATAILSIVVLAGVSSFRHITQGIRQSRTKTISNNIVQEKMEVLKNLSYFQLLLSTDTITNTSYTPNLVYDNSNYPPETIEDLAKSHPRVTFKDCAWMTFEPAEYPAIFKEPQLV